MTEYCIHIFQQLILKKQAHKTCKQYLAAIPSLKNWLQILNLTFRTIILDLIQMKTWLQLNHQFVTKIVDCIEIMKLN
jgi:hypothetical protein